MDDRLDLDPEKRYYSIGEVSELLSVNASLIRFWEKEFPSLKPRKSAKGNRKFTSADIQELRTIHYLVKERGFTLEGARKKMRTDKSDTERKAQIAERLLRLKSSLEKLRDQL